MRLAAGDLPERLRLMRDALPRGTTIDEQRRLRAMGDALGWVIDADGMPVGHPLNEQLIGMGFADLSRTSNVILVVDGSHRFPVARAIPGIGLVDTLVADDAMARQLVA